MDGALAFVTLDVFTQTSFEGNPLAIIKVPASLRHLTQEKKQLIAREFNLSECVFLHEQQDKLIPEWIIDIFTSQCFHKLIGTLSHE
jgi:PhzF family phenazine biosynthesis protein